MPPIKFTGFDRAVQTVRIAQERQARKARRLALVQTAELRATGPSHNSRTPEIRVTELKNIPISLRPIDIRPISTCPKFVLALSRATF